MSILRIAVDPARALDITATAETTFEMDIVLQEAVTGTVALELTDTVTGETVELAGVNADTTLSFRGHYSQMVFPTGVYNHVIVVTDPDVDTRHNLFFGRFILKPRS